MKLVKFLFILGCISVHSFSIAQEKVAYQALLLDENGPMVSRNVEVLLSVSYGNTTARTSLYQESHTTQTDSSGLVSLALGAGAVVNGNWSLIDWSRSDLYLETHLKSGSTQKLMSVSKINAAPKSLYAAQAQSVASNAISTNNLQNGSVTSDKLDSAVVQQISALAAAAVVAQGIPSSGTSTTYKAGSGIQIVNDTIKLESDVARFDAPGFLALNGLAYKNNSSVPWIPDFTQYATVRDIFQDYSFYLGRNSLFSFQVVEQLLTKSLFSDEIGTTEIELSSQDLSQSLKILPQLQNSQLELVVTADLIAQRFKGDGSLLTNLPASSIDTSAYQPIKGLYFQKPTLDFYTSFESDIEQGFLANSALSNSGLAELTNFAEGYLFNPSNDFPLIIGQVGDTLNPKGVVFSTALSGKVVAATKMKSEEIQTTDLITTTIQTPLEQEVVGVTTLNGVETVKVTADQFIGDGSALTGINSVDLGEWNSAKGFYSIRPSSTIEPRIEVLMDSINSNLPIINDLYYYLGPFEVDQDSDGTITEEDGERFGYLGIDRVGADFVASNYGYINKFDSHDIKTDHLTLFNNLYVDEFGDVLFYDSNDDLVIEADRFVGDGSGLTNINTSLASGSVESVHIADATIADADVAANAAIAFSKLDISKANIESLGINNVETLGDLPNTYSTNTSLLIDVYGPINSSKFKGLSNLGIGSLVFKGLTSGVRNVSLGVGNLNALDVGSENIAIGHNSLPLLTSAAYNLALGSSVFRSLDSSDRHLGNIGLGYFAGGSIVSGDDNISIGRSSFSRSNSAHSGDYNIAIGYLAGTGEVDGNYSGDGNIYIGDRSGPNSLVSSHAIAIGSYALVENNGIAIGYVANAAGEYSVAIGYDAVASNANELKLGGTSSTTGIKTITNTNADASFKSISPSSDVRLKRNIRAVSDGMAIVSALKPVKYEKKGSLEATDYDTQEYGFIAQEIQPILPELVKDLGGEDRILTLNYNGLIAILTKALQEQKAEIELLKEQVELLMAER